MTHSSFHPWNRCTLPLSLPEKAMFGNIGRERPGCQQRCNSGRHILRSEPMRLRATHQRSTCACARLIVTSRAIRGVCSARASSATTTQSTRFAAPRFVLSANRGIMYHPLHPRMQAVTQNVRLRSANRDNACNTWNVNSSGNVNNNNAVNALRCAPDCVVLRTYKLSHRDGVRPI